MICKYCGQTTEYNRDWCGSQSCLLYAYRTLIEDINEVIGKLTNNSKRILLNYYQPVEKVVKKRKRKRLKEWFGKTEYSRKSWIHDLSSGDRGYLKRKGITEQQWEDMSPIDQTEWKEECRDAMYEKNDKQLKQLKIKGQSQVSLTK